jgi:GxxExxY protein
MLTRLESKLSPEVEDVIYRVIGCAIEVHRHLGPGYLESIYKKAMCLELVEQSIRFACERAIEVTYKGRPIHSHYLDLVIEDCLVVELKAVSRFEPIHESQVVSYLRATGLHAGLLINFNSVRLKEGIKRIVR